MNRDLSFSAVVARRCVTSLLLALICAVASPTLLAADQPAAKKEAPKKEKKVRKPNIIFVMADDLGYGELGCYGQKWIKTPNIDRIAAEGIRLTDFHSSSPICASSRCSLLTGKHTGHCYIRDNREVRPEGQKPLIASEVTIAEVLKKQGYATAAIGKWGLGIAGSPGDPNKQGFDLFYGFNCQRHAHNHYPKYLWRNDKREILEGNNRTLTGKQYSEDLFREVALQFIEKNKDRPFFLYLPVAIPHLSIQVPEASLAWYKGKIPEEKYEHHGYWKHPFPRAGYAAMITHLDHDIGMIMERIKKLGLDDNTLIVFTSDNGPTYQRLGGSDSKFFKSAGPYRGMKGSLYEGGIRVPFVARWPKHIKPGTESDLPSVMYDVFPTLAEMAGASTPKDVDGISILPTLESKKSQRKHEYLYWEFPGYGGQQAVRVGSFKGVRQRLHRRRGGKKPSMEIELYDLSKDPGEKNNVAAKHPEVVARIKEIMKSGRTPSKQFPQPARDNQ